MVGANCLLIQIIIVIRKQRGLFAENKCSTLIYILEEKSFVEFRIETASKFCSITEILIWQQNHSNLKYLGLFLFFICFGIDFIVLIGRTIKKFANNVEVNAWLLHVNKPHRPPLLTRYQNERVFKIGFSLFHGLDIPVCLNHSRLIQKRFPQLLWWWATIDTISY